MTRTLVVLLAVGLVIAPAAVAKGPHAVLMPGPDAAEPYEPWTATVELYEFRRVPEPSLIATRNDARLRAQVRAEVRKIAPSMADGAAFELATVFPHGGRWKLMLVAGKHRMPFPAVKVGSGEVPQDHVSFPIGSEAARQGAGGVYMEPEPVDASGDGVLPPETFIAAESAGAGDDGGDGVEPWLFPLVGVVLAGAGLATFRRRGSR
jgi:hypothetical protein